MPFELIPQKLVYGGAALGYHEGHPVLVPRALPGERVRVEPVRRAKGVIHARLLEVVEPAPQRIDPPCPYFGRCGGCHYQHLDAENQGMIKREILRETLRRIGKIVWDGPIPVHAGPAWEYRNQAELKAARQPDGGMALGFLEAASHRVCPIDRCLILSPQLNAVLAELHRPEWSPRLAEFRAVTLLADDRDQSVMLTVALNRASREAAAELAELSRAPAGVTAIAVRAEGSDPRLLAGETLRYQAGDFRYRVSPGAFFQASRYLVSDLVSAAADAEGDLAFDLFAGVGLFTLPLARRFRRVIAVEASAAAVSDLDSNRRAAGFDHVLPICATAFDFLRRAPVAEPDLVVLDPPRAGVGAAALRRLIQLRPRRIHYVSCSPPTLARDLGELAGGGYGIEGVELFDFFPQTYHIESLVKLARGAGQAA